MQAVFNIIQSASIIIASIVAIWGINSWRREAKWKRKYEVAEEVLALFYECKEKFQIIRSPFSHSLEGKSRKQGENETIEESKRLDNTYVFFERYEREKEAFNKLFSLKFRFMTLFGKESGHSFDEMKKILNTIFFAANKLGQHYWREQGKNFRTEELFQQHLKEMEENEAIIWGHYDENDKIAKRVDQCISSIEKYCSTIMER
jgi:hypothetical protein